MNKKVNTCCLCGEQLYGFGNNPAPIESDGRCCDMCNSRYVIPARLLLMEPKTKSIIDRQRLAKIFYLSLKSKYEKK